MSAEDRTAQQFRKMTETPIPKLILSLAAPTILSMLITPASITWLIPSSSVDLHQRVRRGGRRSSLMAIIQALELLCWATARGSIIQPKPRQPEHQGCHPVHVHQLLYSADLRPDPLPLSASLTLPHFMMLLGSTETILPHACAYAAHPDRGTADDVQPCDEQHPALRGAKASFAMIGLVTGGVLNMVLGRCSSSGFGLGTAGGGHRHCPEPEHQLLHPAVHVPARQDGQPVPAQRRHPQPGGVRHHPDDRFCPASGGRG